MESHTNDEKSGKTQYENPHMMTGSQRLAIREVV